MFCIDLDSTDPFFNLAVEEYLLKNSRDDFLILGINDKSVIIGKHQVAHRETDTRFVTEKKIPVIRRISGGGTVFHDFGNLNFSFLLNSQEGKQIDFKKYTLPVISFLSSLGVKADFEGKNDLKVHGLKISGNAEHVYHNRILHHGTLLFDADTDLMKGSLRKDKSRYKTRAVGSNPSPVTNLKESLKNIEDIYEFKSAMMRWFLKSFPGTGIKILSDQEKENAELLAGTKYRSWEWNYAYGPEYHFTNSIEIEGRECICRLFVKDGIIWECEMEGFDRMDINWKKVIGCRHMADDLLQIFLKENLFHPGFDIFDLF